jgi:aspartyl-tRNA synthetase
LIPEKIIVLSKANLLPFEVNKDQNVNEDLRLEYRYLDLRRTQMLSNIETRNKITNFIMNFFQKEKFLYIETPTFIKNTPE